MMMMMMMMMMTCRETNLRHSRH